MLVTNGGYAPFVVSQSVRVRSVTGPAATSVDGGNSSRCAQLADGAGLEGFTLTNGAADNGAGIFCESSNVVVTNCFLFGNNASGEGGGAAGGTFFNCAFISNSAASNGGGAAHGVLNSCRLAGNLADAAGGAFDCALSNCVVAGNTARQWQGGGIRQSTAARCVISGNLAANNTGGGAYDSTLINSLIISNQTPFDGGGANSCTLKGCTVVRNVAQLGGGVSFCVSYDSVVFSNRATLSANSANYSGGTFTNSCFTPQLLGLGNVVMGVGNTTANPQFANALVGNFRLKNTSPCLNAGNNFYAVGSTDLDGRARIFGPRVDMGAYEFQSTAVNDLIAWLQRYGLPVDGSADLADSDGDGLNNTQEWHIGTNPTNAASVLQVLTPAVTNTIAGITITWQSVVGTNYFVQRSTNLSALPPFTTIRSNLPGQPGTTSYTDTTATNVVPYFFRVGVP